MDPVFDTFLKDLIKIKQLKMVKKNHKNVISTCIFMPEKPSVNSKTLVYITGLIKNIETFSRTMGDDWILRVYCDDMYFRGVKPKVIETVARADSISLDDEERESELDIIPSYANITYKKNSLKNNFAEDVVNRLNSNISVFESVRNASININNVSNEYVKDVKSTIDSNKKFLKKVEKLLNFYLKKVIASRETRYKNIEIFSYSCPKASKEEHNFLGHFNTFGSIMRFIPLFDPSVNTLFCTNSRYSISPMLKVLLLDWNKNPDKKMFTYSYEAGFIENNIKNNVDQEIENIRIREKKRKIATVEIAEETDLLFKECVNELFEVKHGIFDDDTPMTFENIGKFKPAKKYGLNKYKLKRLNGLINSDFNVNYLDSRSIAAGIFGIKYDCPLIEVRKRVFAKMLRYYILTSVGQYSFEFGIDETLLKIFIAFEVGTMDFNNNYIFYKKFGEKIYENNSNNDTSGLKIDYITNHNDARLGGIDEPCVNILNLYNSNKTFLTDSDNNPIIINRYLDTSLGRYDTGNLFQNILYDIRVYDAKSILVKVKDTYTKPPLNKNEQIVFNWCIGNDSDNLQLDIITLFTYFDEDKPLYIYDSDNLYTHITQFVKNLGIEKDNYYTWFDLSLYNSEKDLLKLINEVISYYNTSINFVDYKIRRLDIDTIEDINKQINGIRFAHIHREDSKATLGMSIRQDSNGEYIIYNIEKMGSADFAGLSINDIIIEFNGINIEGMDFSDVKLIFEQEEKIYNRVCEITYKKKTIPTKKENTYTYAYNLNQSLFNNLSTKELFRKKYTKKTTKSIRKNKSKRRKYNFLNYK